ncbi:MAG: superinfection exclusion B family protein [Succinivibrionaceae bacterium]|nr:superinfection exclusion B family protein [Succinivibrionaceae bacterium]
MDQSNNQGASGIRFLNIVMMWLLCITIMLIVLPWREISPNLGASIADNSMYLYFALCVEISNFISQFLIAIFSRLSDARTSRRQAGRMERTISALDFAERALLREFVLQRRSVLRLPLSEPTVQNLIEEGILRVTGEESESTGKAPCVISQCARPYITYKAIGLSRGKMSADSLEQIMHARPEFARESTMPRAYRSGMRAA